MKDDSAILVRGRRLDGDRMSVLSLREGRVEGIRETDNEGGQLFLAPGLVDLQINGCGGYDFNDSPGGRDDEEAIAKATRLLWEKGVTTYLPTIITNSPEKIERNLARIARACDADPRIAASIGGIHLEGPFISPQDGPRGAHPAEFVRPPDWEAFRRWQEASGGRIRIVTLSPEWPDSLDFISRCVDSGVKAAIGHTAATPERIHEAALAGATLSTHLGNGSHIALPRLANYLWQQLSEDSLYASLIADGFHLPDAVLKVFLRTKGKMAFLISDAVYLTGMPPGDYDTYVGGRVTLGAEGKISLADNPLILAGSALTLVDGIGNLVRKGLATPNDAWEMASVRPASYLGLKTAEGFAIGAPGDFVLVEIKDTGFSIVKTYKAGALVYSRR